MIQEELLILTCHTDYFQEVIDLTNKIASKEGDVPSKLYRMYKKNLKHVNESDATKLLIEDMKKYLEQYKGN